MEIDEVARDPTASPKNVAHAANWHEPDIEPLPLPPPSDHGLAVVETGLQPTNRQANSFCA